MMQLSCPGDESWIYCYDHDTKHGKNSEEGETEEQSQKHAHHFL
jgi:hypothetical protein